MVWYGISSGDQASRETLNAVDEEESASYSACRGGGEGVRKAIARALLPPYSTSHFNTSLDRHIR
jgi:hypothetical protein